ALALAEPREGATGHELPGRLGDDVVVRRGAAAPEGGEILLVPADLLHGQRVALEQVRDGRPGVQEPPDPGQADEADPYPDAARPVNARQEGVLPPPGAELAGHPLGV